MRIPPAVPAALLAVLLSVVPAAVAQGQALSGLPSLPALPVSQAGGYTVLRLQVPLHAGGGAAQQGLPAGVLDVTVTPLPLAGPGGSVGADAYLVDASILTPDGRLPLPSMLIDPADEGLPDDAAGQVDDVVDGADALNEQLAAVSDQLEALGLPDAAGEAASLAEQSDWVGALAAAAAKEAGSGAASEVARAEVLLAYASASADVLSDEVDEFVGHFGPPPTPSPTTPSPTAPSPTTPSAPSISSTPALPTLPPESSSSVSSSPPPSNVDEATAAAMAIAQEQSDALAAKAAEAEGAVDALVADATGFVGSLVDVQGLLSSALVAIGDARAMLNDTQDSLGDPDGPDPEALPQVQQAEAELLWAKAFADAASESDVAIVQGAATEASGFADDAASAAQDIAALVEDALAAHSPPEAQPLVAQARAALDGADDPAAAAQSALETALGLLGPVPGGLPPAPDTDDLPVHADAADPARRLAVCVMGEAGQACGEYASPDTPDHGTVTVLVAIPDVLTLEQPIPPDTSSLTGAPGVPTGVPPPPGVGVPPVPLPSSSSAAPSPSEEPSESSSSSSSGAASSSSSSAASTSSMSSSTSASSSSEAASSAKAVLSIEVPASIAIDEGQQADFEVIVRNAGDAADDVAITAQGDAPVSAESPTESLHVAPGEAKAAHLRLTPTHPGSGHLTLIATGKSGGTVSKESAVLVRDLPEAAANIDASVEPTSVSGQVGQATLVTIRVVNSGSAADVVKVVASAGSAAMSIEPDTLEVALGPGESAVRQVRVVPLAEGHATLSVHLTSTKGLDVTPIASFASAGTQHSEHGPADGGASGSESGDSGSKGSPFVGFPLMAAGLAAAAGAVLRRRRA